MSFLDDVLVGVRQNLQDGYYDMPAEVVKFQKSSLKAVLQQSFSVIAEIKPVSPTAGTLYTGSAKSLAQTYRDAGARAISVLCEKTRFAGRLENLAEAKGAGLPVLAKDFVVSVKQLQAYAAHGADAVLLIYELFERKKTDLSLEAAIQSAHQNGLDVLLEVHTADALKKALETDADVIGINNRNLDDLSLNVLHFQNVLHDADLDATHAKKPIIAESGFQSREDVDLARAAGLNGVLIGTGLLKAENPKAALHELTRI